MVDASQHRHLDTILLIEPDRIPHQKAMEALEHTGRSIERIPTPLSAFAELCLLERQYDMRRSWGLTPGNRPALLIHDADQCAELTDIVNAAFSRLPLVEVWAIRDDGIHVYRTPIDPLPAPDAANDAVAATRWPEEIDENDPDIASGRTDSAEDATVGREEIAMLLGPSSGESDA